MTTEPTFLIVGGGLAGALAAQTLREEGFDGRITLLGDEPHRPYERPPLSKDYLQGNADRDSIFVHPEPWYIDHAVELCLGTAVASLDPASRTVTTATGVRLGYDKLLLATGSTPRRLSLPGSDLDGVHYLRSVDDSERIKAGFVKAHRVAIIGAGWIGLETAAAARNAGLDVTLLEHAELPLLRVLGPETAPIFADLHRDHGVDLRCQVAVAELTGSNGAVTGVMLSDGSRIDADMVLVGIGITPNTELAAAAGLHVDNGIIVEEHLRTSDPDIYAAGDVANAYNPRLGRHLRVEHWANARRQGATAAKAMLGHQTRRHPTVVLLLRPVRPRHGVHRRHRTVRLRPGHLPPTRRSEPDHRLLAPGTTRPRRHEHQHLGCRRRHRTTRPISTPSQHRRPRQPRRRAHQFAPAASHAVTPLITPWP